MISKQAKDFIDSIDTPGRVLEINLDFIPSLFKTPFSCKKCGSHNYTLNNFLVKCNDCGNIEEKLLTIPPNNAADNFLKLLMK